LISDPELLVKAARVDAEEGDEELAALARDVLDMSAQEHWGMHRSSALRALRIYSSGSPLHLAGINTTIIHAQLLSEKYIVFIVGPQRHMSRLGAHYALHLQGFVEALMGDARGQVDFILDEATNAPLKALVSSLTTMRGYGGNCHFIAQSRSELQRAYGEKETATIEDQAVVKQYFGFSSFEEAERLSSAMGEAPVMSKSLGFSSGGLDVSGNFGTNKERIFTPERLMRLPADEQIIHVKDVGFIHCRKVQQHQIAPFCHGELADNPLEGPQRPADPLVSIEPQKGGRT
jgi:type IV secretion system protein VirD4